MTVDEVLRVIAALDPTQLSLLMKKASLAFSKRAEDVYQLNPEDNGALAQPYADLAALLLSASDVFAKPVPVSDFVDEIQAPKVMMVPNVPSPWVGR